MLVGTTVKSEDCKDIKGLMTSMLLNAVRELCQERTMWYRVIAAEDENCSLIT